MCRVGVKNSNPEVTRQGIQLAKQSAQARRTLGKRADGGGESLGRSNRPAVFRTQVQSVIGRVLRYEVQFLHTVGKQSFGLRHDVGKQPAPVRATHSGNNAKTARMVAALCNLD